MHLDTLSNIPSVACPRDAPPGVVGFVSFTSEHDGSEGWRAATLISVIESRDRVRIRIDGEHDTRVVGRESFRVMLTRRPLIVKVAVALEQGGGDG